MELWLPRSSRPASKADKEEKTAHEELVEAVDKRLPTVLLIDDSAHLREMTAMSLRHFGFDVVVAAGGAEALAAIENEPDRFDVIVTDFAMPLVSGIDVIRFARNLRAGWPAVIVTGYADAEKIVDRPADVAIINKPFQEKDLVESIRLAVARQPRPVDRRRPR
jgi:DNA-binding NtrC family response regulator